MQIKLEQVPKIVIGIRWGLIGLALMCVFVFQIPGGGILFAALYFVFSTAMRIERSRIWIVSRLTGLSHDELRKAAQQHKQAQLYSDD